jgi:hypothetical protein
MPELHEIVTACNLEAKSVMTRPELNVQPKKDTEALQDGWVNTQHPPVKSAPVSTTRERDSRNESEVRFNPEEGWDKSK